MTTINQMCLAILEALGMGDCHNVVDVTININATDWPAVTVVTEHATTDGLEPFFEYISEDFALRPKSADTAADPLP